MVMLVIECFFRIILQHEDKECLVSVLSFVCVPVVRRIQCTPYLNDQCFCHISSIIRHFDASDSFVTYGTM